MIPIGRFKEWKDVTTQLDVKFKENMDSYILDWSDATSGRQLYWKNQWHIGYDLVKTNGIPLDTMKERLDRFFVM